MQVQQRQQTKKVDSILFQEFPILKDMSILLNINCKELKKADFVCIKNDCLHYPFLCSDKHCKCKKQHQKCMKILAEDFLLRIQQNVTYLDMLIQSHDQKLNQFSSKIILQIEKLKSCFRKQINDKCKQLSFTAQQLQILQKMQTNSIQNLTGNDFHIAYQQCEEIKRNKNQFNFIQEIQCMSKTWKQLQQMFMYEMEQIRQLWQVNRNERAFYASGQLIQSKIAIKPEESKIIKEFFDKKILKFQLLYRASDHEFKLESFHKYCDKIQNTLILVQTEFGKKIGGFTPLLWRYHKGEYLPDQSNSSFLFSLTNNQKLTQKNLESGIRNHQKYGPIFGNQQYWDFYISQAANSNQNSHFSFNYGYVHQNAKSSSEHNYQRFCGNPNNSGNYSAKQWEVWRVIFE